MGLDIGADEGVVGGRGSRGSLVEQVVGMAEEGEGEWWRGRVFGEGAERAIHSFIHSLTRSQ